MTRRQLDLGFDLSSDLSDIPSMAPRTMPALINALQRSMGMPVRDIDTSTCSTCHGVGDVYVDRSEPGRDHFTAHNLCPDCSGSDDAARETASEVRAEMAAR